MAAISNRTMTTTEVVERSAEMARILGATYGRLQSELLTPLVLRAVDILRKRGEVPDIPIDGRMVSLDHRSPLAQAQAQREVQTTLSWLEAASALGPDAQRVVDSAAAARWLGKTLGVPPELMRDTPAPISPPVFPPRPPGPHPVPPATGPLPPTELSPIEPFPSSATTQRSA